MARCPAPKHTEKEVYVRESIIFVFIFTTKEVAQSVEASSHY